MTPAAHPSTTAVVGRDDPCDLDDACLLIIGTHLDLAGSPDVCHDPPAELLERWSRGLVEVTAQPHPTG